ncbi:hypothetical protein [Cohnella soli]|uniref:Uncharacterized protein n=1 Tax=Cohnella soli TaxID=425005 RepID=A0ABW0HU74_9BACL
MKRNRIKGLLLAMGIVLNTGCAEHSAQERSTDRVKDQEIVASVDGEPIRYGEFALMMMRERSKAVQYFYDKYKAEDSTRYWTTRFGKEIPIEWLKSAALDEARRIKVQQMIARDEGIVQRIDYSDFRNGWIEENERRRKAADKKMILYGPLQYDENTYYDYVFSNMVFQVKEKQRESSGLTVEEGEKRYEKLVDRRLGAVTEVIERDVYDRIKTP